MNAAITRIERITHSQTWRGVKVRMDVEPKRVEQTSPVRFDDFENIFINK